MPDRSRATSLTTQVVEVSNIVEKPEAFWGMKYFYLLVVCPGVIFQMMLKKYIQESCWTAMNGSIERTFCCKYWTRKLLDIFDYFTTELVYFTIDCKQH